MFCGVRLTRPAMCSVRHAPHTHIELPCTATGCNFTDPTINTIAKSRNVTVAQVCLRYVIDRKCVLAVGTFLKKKKKKEEERPACMAMVAKGAVYDFVLNVVLENTILNAPCEYAHHEATLSCCFNRSRL